nr:hypothetical protein [Tanacetum cinerariifolium]
MSFQRWLLNKTVQDPVFKNLQAPTASMSIQDSSPAPTNSSNTPVFSHNREIYLLILLPHFPSSTPLSITYPLNDFQSSVNHNVYNPSSLIPQVEYAPTVHQQSEFSKPDTGLVVLVFQKGDDPINAINHMMSFLTAVVTLRYPSTNHQLKTSSNPRQQTTINNGRVTIQPIQGRQNSMTAGVIA